MEANSPAPQVQLWGCQVIVYVKRKFGAAHRLPSHPGKCNRLHGHTWTVESWSQGTPDQVTGMVVDFGDVKQVIDDLGDHQSLNDTLHDPTAENLALYLLKRIPLCVRVRVWESEDTYVEATHDDLPG